MEASTMTTYMIGDAAAAKQAQHAHKTVAAPAIISRLIDLRRVSTRGASDLSTGTALECKNVKIYYWEVGEQLHIMVGRHDSDFPDFHCVVHSADAAVVMDWYRGWEADIFSLEPMTSATTNV
jgi:hypothetical protein